MINGYMSSEIQIMRSVRQGCPMAPLLYICVIETLLIQIRSNCLIKGIKSPTSNENLMLSAFADDTNFFIDSIESTENVLSTFEIYGKASGSKINRDKTEGMWLGYHKNKSEKPLNIKWVKNTECLGTYFGYSNIQNLNWINCIDNFKRDISRHNNRNCTIFGKTTILNYIGYSKLWFKAFHSCLPETLCYRPNGQSVDIIDSLNKLTQGFLWGFRTKNEGMTTDYANPKTPSISKLTLYLPKEKGGTNLIDFRTKMKSFRILMVYKYLKCQDKVWSSILRYWYAANIYSISGERWDNSYPHSQDIDNIPSFFPNMLDMLKWVSF